MYTSGVVFLRIASWAECWFGQHYYGDILWKEDDDPESYEHNEETVVYTLDKKTAAQLNRGEPESSKYKEGEETGRFLDRDTLLNVAKSIWKVHAPHGKVLLIGDGCDLGPQEVVAAFPYKLMRLGNQLWLADTCAGNSWNNKREALLRQWQKLFKRYGLWKD